MNVLLIDRVGKVSHRQKQVKLFIYFLCIFREGKGGDREGEKHQCVVTSHTLPAGDLAHNPGMCPRLGIESVSRWFIGWRSIH